MIAVKSYLEKSLSTSYSYFIHVSRYTKNSKKAKSAIAVKAKTETVIKHIRNCYSLLYGVLVIKMENEAMGDKNYTLNNKNKCIICSC